MQKVIFTFRNVRIVMLYLALFIFGANAYAQQTNSLPMSFFLSLNKSVQQVNLPDVDRQRLLEEDKITIKNMEAAPYRFGVVQAVNVGLNNGGTWETLSDGSRIWRLTVSSEGAYCVYPIFNNFYLPKGSTLHVYSPDQKAVRGAFNSDNNNDAKVFAISVIPGKTITIEYYEPKNVKGQGKFNVESIVHSYRDILNPDSPEELACNININCPVGVPWATQKRGVAKITFTIGGSGFLCSGSLINNTAQDRKRYFLTANHCESDNNGAIVFDFNYEAANCSGTSITINSITGSTLRANNPDSDTRLLEITPSIPANYNVYYNGWDRSGNTPLNETAIHHPGGAIKKFSHDNDQAVNSNGFGTTIANSCWRVIWDIGFTEGGSSGCPLFDENKRIIGQNYGGTEASCPSNPGIKYFGKFWMSWDHGGAASNQLKNWLDAGNVAGMTLDGIEGNTGVAPTANFTADSTVVSPGGVVNFYDISVNTVTSWAWSFPGGNPSSSTLQNPPPVTYPTTGSYAVSLTVTNSFGPNTLTRANYIHVNGAPMSAFDLSSPANLSSITVAATSSAPFTFAWTSASAAPTVTYKLKIRKIGSSVDNIYASDNSGALTSKTFTCGFLDSLALQFGTTSLGDSARCSWRAWAYNGVDSAAATSTYLLYIKRSTVGISLISTVVPDQFALYSNYPNPFNPNTIIKFDIAKQSDTKLRVFDMLGKEVSLLVNKTLQAGQYSVDFKAASLPSGVYFYRLETPDFVVTKRMMLVK